MIAETVEEMYRTDTANEFLEVTYQNGDKEILYYKDFSSGAMIENIVRRAKKLAIKRVIAGGERGVSLTDMWVLPLRHVPLFAPSPSKPPLSDVNTTIVLSVTLSRSSDASTRPT